MARPIFWGVKGKSMEPELDVRYAKERSAPSLAEGSDFVAARLNSEELFRLMVSTVKDYAIFMLDPEGRVTTWNEGARDIKGYTEAEILGKHFSIFYPIDKQLEQHPNRELERAARDGKYEEEGWRVRKDGSQFWASVLITCIRSAEGDLIGFTKVTRDLTEHKRNEEARLVEISLNARLAQLEASERQFRSLADSIPQLAWMADTDGARSWFNQRWYDYTGAAGEHARSWGWKLFQHPAHAERVLESYRRHIQAGLPWEDTFPLRHQSGTWRWFLERAVPIRDDSGRIVKWFGTSTDIDEQKRMREQLSRALNTRDDFLSMASHELKTPLTSLKLLLQLAMRNARQNPASLPELPKISDLFSLSLRQVDLLTDLVEDLLDTSRIQSGKFTLNLSEVNLSHLLRETAQKFATQLRASACELQLNLQENVIGFWDPSRLDQALSNLILNALKHAPRSPLHISLVQRGQRVRINVQDFGQGVPRERRTKIFERFEKAQAKNQIGGLGLGLFIVKTIVEAHQGVIRVEDDTVQGSLFTIELPLKSTHPCDPQPIEEENGKPS